MNTHKLQPEQENARRGGTASNDNLPSQTASDRRLLRGLPWAWIALSGLATLVWLVGIGWIAVKLARWLVG